MNPDFEMLAGIRFVKCEIQPVYTAVDDGCRVYTVGQLPDYLRRREIIEGDSLNLLTIMDGQEAVFRLLIPCANNCPNLAAPLRPGCRVLHVAAHNPGLAVAELAALDDVNIALADRIFGTQLPDPTIYIFSDQSVLFRRYPREDSMDRPFRTIVDFVRAYCLEMADSEAGSALGKFRLFCATEHIDVYFEAFLPAEAHPALLY